MAMANTPSVSVESRSGLIVEVSDLSLEDVGEEAFMVISVEARL